MSAAMSEQDIICERRGAAGCVLLNRPRALNALTHEMVEGLAAALEVWERDPAVERVVISGAGDRAFCAGGDIRVIHDLGKAGDHATQLRFWREEYILNRRIKRYSKPYVALIDGFIMGGGVGVSIHGSHRVAGDKLAFAMPEVSIGLFPDVGGTYFLTRLPGRSGAWLALTGARIGTGDACALGLATHFTPSARMGELARALEAAGDTDAILARFAAPPPAARHAGDRGVIDQCFGAPDVAGVFAALRDAAGQGNAFAAETLASLEKKSPTSVALSLRQLQLGAGLDIEAALQLEYRMVSRVCRGHDFYEGVRAVLIDKDNAPGWRPPGHADVRAADIEAHFAPLGAEELVFPPIGPAP